MEKINNLRRQNRIAILSHSLESMSMIEYLISIHEDTPHFYSTRFLDQYLDTFYGTIRQKIKYYEDYELELEKVSKKKFKKTLPKYVISNLILKKRWDNISYSSEKVPEIASLCSMYNIPLVTFKFEKNDRSYPSYYQVDCIKENIFKVMDLLK